MVTPMQLFQLSLGPHGSFKLYEVQSLMLQSKQKVLNFLLALATKASFIVTEQSEKTVLLLIAHIHPKTFERYFLFAYKWFKRTIET